MKIEDNCEAFDWAFALYYWFSHWHGGQWSDEYAAMCKLVDEYKLGNVPDIDFDNNDCDEYEMAVMYYNELNQDNWESYFQTFCDYMDNDWDNNSY